MSPLEALQNSAFGKRTAEEEREQLRQYFVETDQWNRVIDGSVDVVYGPKGSGKSAIYSLISLSSDELKNRKILVVEGENPQGTPAFSDIIKEPPYDEFEFVNLWKLYILTLVGHAIRENGIKNDQCDKVVAELERADLIPSSFSLSRVLKYVSDYVRSYSKAEALETELKLDPMTQMPSGLAGRIVFREPSAKAEKAGIRSIDELYSLASEGLKKAEICLWVLLDRLDVAFADNRELEAAALRALFKFYLDTNKYKQIRTKIFLRTDIWQAITEQGFREASHIENSIDINWKFESLVNLVVTRMLSNDAICEYYEVSREDILGDYESQLKFLQRIFPDQVETGSNKPNTFSWILGRTKDGTEDTSPRELIHFLNELRIVQISRLERGQGTLPEGALFEQVAFKDALPAVSKTRLEQTLFAEFPHYKKRIEALREQKATQNVGSLAKLWGVDEREALEIASGLEKIGFFEPGRGNPVSWRVPFLYRPALDLVQGAADKAVNDD